MTWNWAVRIKEKKYYRLRSSASHLRGDVRETRVAVGDRRMSKVASPNSRETATGEKHMGRCEWLPTMSALRPGEPGLLLTCY